MVVKDLKPIKLGKYSGRNTFSDITNIGQSEFREITNFDIYGGMNGDYLRVRRGSEIIVPEVDPQKLPDNILNKVVFPTAAGEFFIYNVNASGTGKFYAQREGENPFLISAGADLVVSGAIVDYISDLVLVGVPNGQTVYIQVEDDTTDFVFTVWDGEWGSSNLLASGSISNATVLPAPITLLEEEDSGVSGTVTLDVDPATIKQGSAAYPEFDVDDNVNPVDMKVYNDRVYVFSQTGNKIIYYDADEDTLFGRPMGLEPMLVSSTAVFGTGAMPANGLWYYGVEKVTQKDGADLVASSPNRNLTNGELIQVATTSSLSSVAVFLDAATVDDDPYWTHLRLWRSKNATVDLSDPLSPIDAQGTPDELYEVALITRAEMLGAFGPIDTGTDLPPGNANVSAGVDSGFYIIEDGNDDSVLVNVIGLDLIGLIPLPGCRTGTVNKGRIWASGIGDDFIAPQGPMIDPVIREDWLYTTEQFSQYQEQWDAQAYLNAGRDGDRTESLLTLLEDVIGFRSSTTRRVASGNPASLCQMLDDKIGVPSFRCTGYITGIGICAICSDGYFRYLGFDQRWHQYIGKTEISQSIYDLTAGVVDDQKADFVYMNGKLLMLIPDGAIAALGVKEGKGWSLYDYPDTFAVAFNFSDGERAACAQDVKYLLEIETAATTDADNDDVDADPIDITASFEGFAFTSESSLFEVTKYSFWGKLSSVPTVTAKSSNQTWRVQSSFIDPGLFAANTDLNEREYVFFPQPLDTTPFKWVPLRGQYITFSVSLVGPAMISWQQVEARMRDTKGDLGVFPYGGLIPQGPGWNQSLLMMLNFEDPGDIFYDASGKGLNHVWSEGEAPVGTKSNRITQKPVKGVSFTPNGTINYATDPSSILMGSKSLTWKAVVALSSEGMFAASGKNGAYSWRLVMSPDGLRMDINANGTEYNYTLNDFTPSATVVYAVAFYLSTDLTGEFWVESLASSSFTERTTIRTSGSIIPTIPTGHSLASEVYDADEASTVKLSFYSIEKTYTYTEQAKRFWGTVKAY